MHITIDICNKTRCAYEIMIILCIISFFLFAANREWGFMHTMTPTGIFRRLPYFYVGYLMGRKHFFNQTRIKKDAFYCPSLLLLSLLFFRWHLHENRVIPHIILFYPANFCFLFGVLYGCKLLNGVKTKIIENISIGSLLIIGLHMLIIGVVNYTLEHNFYIRDKIFYYWFEALPLCFIIIALLYPLISFSKNHFPTLIRK